MPVQVFLGQNESLESGLKRFKRMVEKDGILQECKKREFFVKPSMLNHQKNIERRKKQIAFAKKREEREEKMDKKINYF